MTELLDPQPSTNGVAAARRRRRWLWVAAALAVGGAAFVLFWFQPQKLFIDDRVDEAIPSATTGAPVVPPSDGAATTPPDAPAPTEPLELTGGEFVSLDHGTSGTARVLELADGSRIVRLEGLDTSNGPDLFVYLSSNPASGDEGAFDDDFVNLGRLKGNQGDQNYDLPADVDLARFASVVVWCDRFDSAFGAADLVAA
ncbi:MAG: DM13 domain-containing protein [Acidimicrobiales bacterium]